MCGILGLILGHVDDPASTCDAAIDLHDALYYLQHRGQDACGIATCGVGGRIYQAKGNGMAAKVFQEGSKLNSLPGFCGIGHLRYPTAGTSSSAESQPFYVNSPYGICFAHNGNLVNAEELRTYLDQTAHRHINTDSDSEIMLNIFANELNETGKARVNKEDIFTALSGMFNRCQGGFACTAMIAGFAIIGFRDSHGIRPLVLGSRKSSTLEGAMDYMLASESVALRQLGFTDIQDIEPGQAVIIQKGGQPEFRQVAEKKADALDVFEFVYYSRPDSTMAGISVNKAREKMGEKLAYKIKETLGDQVNDIDAVIPIPETANTAAAVVSQVLGKPLSNAFIKSRYVFRTFIQPGQQARMKSVRRKLSALPSEFEGRCVLMIDDSLVRGTTSREIVSMARECGSRKIIFASTAPPITHPHIYGIDLASPDELIAHNKNTAEIAKHIGVDELIYQSLDDLVLACSEASPDGKLRDFECGVFSGKYKTEVPDGYFEKLNQRRGKKRKLQVIEEVRQPTSGGADGDAIVANGGPVNVTAHAPSKDTLKIELRNANQSLDQNGTKTITYSTVPQTPDNREDISIHNLATDEHR